MTGQDIWLSTSSWARGRFATVPYLLQLSSNAAGCESSEPTATWWCHLRVRIIETPRERELDGVRLDGLRREMVRDVAPSLGAWLVAQEYAVLEMRAHSRDEDQESSFVSHPSANADDRQRRRSTDR